MAIRVLMSLLVISFLLPAFLLGCSGTENAPEATIPTIDASVPAETETATFALG